MKQCTVKLWAPAIERDSKELLRLDEDDYRKAIQENLPKLEGALKGAADGWTRWNVLGDWKGQKSVEAGYIYEASVTNCSGPTLEGIYAALYDHVFLGMRQDALYFTVTSGVKYLIAEPPKSRTLAGAALH
ncbi:MAG: hypothetical protein QM784_09805 [Polyangiaceae bacterium]